MKIKRVADSTKAFVSNHRVAIAVAATATVFVVSNKYSAKAWDKFLIEHGIDPIDYWNPDHD